MLTLVLLFLRILGPGDTVTYRVPAVNNLTLLSLFLKLSSQ